MTEPVVALPIATKRRWLRTVLAAFALLCLMRGLAYLIAPNESLPLAVQTLGPPAVWFALWAGTGLACAFSMWRLWWAPWALGCVVGLHLVWSALFTVSRLLGQTYLGGVSAAQYLASGIAVLAVSVITAPAARLRERR